MSDAIDQPVEFLGTDALRNMRAPKTTSLIAYQSSGRLLVIDRFREVGDENRASTMLEALGVSVDAVVLLDGVASDARELAAEPELSSHSIRVVLGALGFGIIVIGILALAWYGHITPSTTVVLLSWSGLLGSLLGAFAYCGLLCCGTRIRRACEVCTSGIHRWCLQAAESRARRRQVNAEMGAQLFHPSGV